jgi:hypothetical protein
MPNGIQSTDRGLPAKSGQGVNFGPEMDRITQLALGDLPKPFVLLAEDEGEPSRPQSFKISLQNGIADIFALEG